MRVMAILCSDVHLSEKPPIARSGEPSWFDAMRRPLRFIRELAEEHEAPVVIAGDVFHKWKASPELINFALEELPQAYAVAGQHDLPYHDYDQMHKTAYGTLVLAGKLINLHPDEIESVWVGNKQLHLIGYPWNHPLEPVDQALGGVTLAVVHAYVWKARCGFPGAPETAKIGTYDKVLADYDAAVFGDNHITFEALTSGGCHVLNCGSLMRRNSDQVDHRPVVGLLMEDGTIETRRVPIADDVLAVTDAELLPEEDADAVREFVGSLANLTSDKELTYRTIIERYLADREVEPRVKTIIEEALDA